MRAIFTAGVFVVASAAVAAPIVPPVLTTPEARDVLTYAEPSLARVTHVDLDLTADFQAHVMRGAATLDILAAPGASRLVLDDKSLAIASITDTAGRPLRWSVGPDEAYKGAPLTVDIGAARRIVIRYASAPDARALQWLAPALTAGKGRPYLFSQGEAINNRTWIPTQDSPGIRQSWSAPYPPI